MVYGVFFSFVIICGIWAIMFLRDTKNLSYKDLMKYIVVVIAIISGIGFKLYSKYEIEKFQDIHNNEVVFSYIDSMSIVDLRNKLKACQIDSSNCTIVFPQK
jgi:hypothetical protein